MLLTDARRNAPTDPDGAPVSFEDQDRRRWDAEQIAEGRAPVTEALAAPPPNPYAVQAAIAALQDEAPDVATTDWAHVVAVRDGPAAGLALIDRVAAAPELAGYHPLPAARGPPRSDRRGG